MAAKDGNPKKNIYRLKNSWKSNFSRVPPQVLYCRVLAPSPFEWVEGERVEGEGRAGEGERVRLGWNRFIIVSSY